MDLLGLVVFSFFGMQIGEFEPSDRYPIASLVNNGLEYAQCLGKV